MMHKKPSCSLMIITLGALAIWLASDSKFASRVQVLVALSVLLVLAKVWFSEPSKRKANQSVDADYEDML